MRLDARHTEPAWAFIGVRSTLSVCYLRTFQRSGRMAHYTFACHSRCRPTDGTRSGKANWALLARSTHRHRLRVGSPHRLRIASVDGEEEEEEEETRTHTIVRELM